MYSSVWPSHSLTFVCLSSCISVHVICHLTILIKSNIWNISDQYLSLFRTDLSKNKAILSSPLLLLLPSATARSMKRRRKEAEAIIIVESSSMPGQGQIRKALHHQGEYRSESVHDCHWVLGQTQVEDLTNKEVSPLTDQKFQAAWLQPLWQDWSLFNSPSTTSPPQPLHLDHTTLWKNGLLAIHSVLHTLYLQSVLTQYVYSTQQYKELLSGPITIYNDIVTILFETHRLLMAYSCGCLKDNFYYATIQRIILHSWMNRYLAILLWSNHENSWCQPCYLAVYDSLTV